jgi:hypothetical protein
MRASFTAHLILFDLITLIISVVMKLLIMQSSPAARNFLPLSSKYSPQDSVLKNTFNLRGCIQKFPDWVNNEMNNNNNKHSLRSNTKGYGGKSH